MSEEEAKKVEETKTETEKSTKKPEADEPPPLESIEVTPKSEAKSDEPPPLEKIEPTPKSDSSVPPATLEEVSTENKTDNDEPPPLEAINGNNDDLPPLEEVQNADLNDDIPPLEEVSTKKEEDDEIPPLEEPVKDQTPLSSENYATNEINPSSQQMIPGLKSQSKRSRSEKKAKKALLKNQSLVQVKDVTRVVIKQNKILFIFDEPEVYKTAKRFYVVFGEAVIRDISQMKADMIGEKIFNETKQYEEEIKKKDEDVEEEKEKEGEKQETENKEEKDENQQKEEEGEKKEPEEGKKEEPDDAADDAEVSDAESDVSLGEINEKDVEVVMDQANTTRKKAITALKAADGGLVFFFINVLDVVDAVMQIQTSGV